MSDNVVVDSEGYSDLDPQLAPVWSVQVKMVALPACLLGEYMTDFLHLCNNRKTMVELLGENASYIHDDDQTLSAALDALTESRIPTISTVVGRASAKKNRNVDGPISEDTLLTILYFLFPDADDSSVHIASSESYFIFSKANHSGNHSDDSNHTDLISL